MSADRPAPETREQTRLDAQKDLVRAVLDAPPGDFSQLEAFKQVVRERIAEAARQETREPDAVEAWGEIRRLLAEHDPIFWREHADVVERCLGVAPANAFSADFCLGCPVHCGQCEKPTAARRAPRDDEASWVEAAHGDPVKALAAVREIILDAHCNRSTNMSDAFYDRWLVETVSGPFDSIPAMLRDHLEGLAARPAPEQP